MPEEELRFMDWFMCLASTHDNAGGQPSTPNPRLNPALSTSPHAMLSNCSTHIILETNKDFASSLDYLG
eukprot:3884901-Amphidinium_carterae.1